MSESEGDGGAGPILAMTVVGILALGGLGFLVAFVLVDTTPSAPKSSPIIVAPTPMATTGTVTPPSTTTTIDPPPIPAPAPGEDKSDP